MAFKRKILSALTCILLSFSLFSHVCLFSSAVLKFIFMSTKVFFSFLNYKLCFLLFLTSLHLTFLQSADQKFNFKIVVTTNVMNIRKPSKSIIAKCIHFEHLANIFIIETYCNLFYLPWVRMLPKMWVQS
jgi:hypothetical protein